MGFGYGSGSGVGSSWFVGWRVVLCEVEGIVSRYWGEMSGGMGIGGGGREERRGGGKGKGEERKW